MINREDIKRVSAIAAAVTLALLFFSALSNGAVVTVDASAREGVKVPIIMYHSVLKDKSRTGKFIITPEIFRSDMLCLLDNGYTPVFIQDLIDYAFDASPLPKKPVVITFDDGYYNNLTYVMPIVEELKLKIVISPVGEFTEIYSDSTDLNPSYSHLTWNDIASMNETGFVEFQNHSYGMHHDNGARKGANIARGETMEHYKDILEEDVMKMQSLLYLKSGVKATAFAYPFGYYSKQSEEVLKAMGFLCTLSCEERISSISTPETLFNMGRFNRAGNLSTAEFMQKLFKAG